jgi:hypothetical protein
LSVVGSKRRKRKAELQLSAEFDQQSAIPNEDVACVIARQLSGNGLESHFRANAAGVAEGDGDEPWIRLCHVRVEAGDRRAAAISLG